MRPHRTSRRALLRLAAGLTVALALTACGTHDGSTPMPPTGKAPVIVTSIAGEKISLPAVGKPTAVFFFTVGCGECAGGVASLAQAAASAEKDGIKAQFLAVDADPGESADTVKSFMDYVDAGTVPAAIDTGAAVSQRYRMTALSTLVVIDAKGEVTYRATDPSAKAITAELKKAGA